MAKDTSKIFVSMREALAGQRPCPPHSHANSKVTAAETQRRWNFASEGPLPPSRKGDARGTGRGSSYCSIKVIGVTAAPGPGELSDPLAL
jgi:hypothetical protein